MRKSKHGPALFELLGDRGLRSSRGDFAPREASLDAELTAEPDDEDRPAAAALIESAASWPEAALRPAFAIDGERLHVSLTSLSAAGAAFVLVALLAVGVGLGFRQGKAKGLADGFAAGRASYVADTAGDIEAARRQSPATYLVGGLLDSSQSTAGPAVEMRAPTGEIGPGGEPREPEWLDGYTYVVAQEFSLKNVNDVDPARRFLAEHGVETVPVPLSSGGMRLITTQGFDRKDPAQRKLADQLLEKVRAIGAQYFASGGRYKLEGYFKTLTGEG